jgi:hypothetical protein
LPDHKEDANKQEHGGDPVRVVKDRLGVPPPSNEYDQPQSHRRPESPHKSFLEGGEPRSTLAGFVSSSKVCTVQKTMKNRNTAASTQKSERGPNFHSRNVTAATHSVARAQL